MGENAAVVKAAYEAFEKGDIETLLGMLEPNVEWHAPETLPQGGQFRGADEVLGFFQRLGSTWDPLVLEVEALGEVGPDLVAGVVKGSGSLSSGNEASYGAVHVFTVESGRITKFREYVDLDAPLT